MTAHKHLKERIRARMARTGESYTTARRHVLNALPPSEYQLLGGLHPDAHAIAGVLANRGLLHPGTGQPLSEAMVLGVGGGLGAGYILWEFKAHDLRSLVFGFRNSWQYPDRWARKTCQRLGVPAAVHETGSAGKADAELRAAVGQGVPAIAWADQQALGYRHLPAWLDGRGGPPVTVYAIDDAAGVALIDDRNRAPLRVPLDALAAARARVGSYKHRLVVLDAPAAELDAGGLRRAVRDGLAEQVEHLGRRSDSFSLPAFRKWARLLTDRRNAKGWPTVFADRVSLFDACLSVYEGLEPSGSGGGNLRGLYAEFLDEAAGLLDAPALGKRRPPTARPPPAGTRWPPPPCPPAASRSPRPAASPTSSRPRSRGATPPSRRRPPPPPTCGPSATAGGPSSPATTRTSRPCWPPWPPRSRPPATPRRPPWASWPPPCPAADPAPVQAIVDGCRSCRRRQPSVAPRGPA
jgi:hypothetical protein